MATMECSMMINHGIDVIHERPNFKIFLRISYKRINFSVEFKPLQTKGKNWTSPLKSILFFDGSEILAARTFITGFLRRNVLIKFTQGERLLQRRPIVIDVERYRRLILHDLFVVTAFLARHLTHEVAEEQILNYGIARSQFFLSGLGDKLVFIFKILQILRTFRS